MSTMKAIVVEGESGSTSLVWADVPTPDCGPDEVIVDVRATALNRADLMQREGRYDPPPGDSRILGLEASGVVSELGSAVTDVEVGQEVCCLLGGGGYAERVSVPARMLMPVPAGLSLEEAAGIPEVFLTAYSALFREGRLTEGETVLLHAGASGVGTAALQLARRAGCQVITTAGSDQKVEACRGLGAELAINYRNEDFAERILAFSNGRGVDVIVDVVGKEYFERNLKVLATWGRMVVLATLSGADVALNLRSLLAKRLSLVATTLRSRPLGEKIALRDEFLMRFGEDLARGAIRPVIDSTFPIARADEAHQYMRENRNIGKILLTIE